MNSSVLIKLMYGRNEEKDEMVCINYGYEYRRNLEMVNSSVSYMDEKRKMKNSPY